MWWETRLRGPTLSISIALRDLDMSEYNNLIILLHRPHLNSKFDMATFFLLIQGRVKKFGKKCYQIPSDRQIMLILYKREKVFFPSKKKIQSNKFLKVTWKWSKFHLNVLDFRSRYWSLSCLPLHPSVTTSRVNFNQLNFFFSRFNNNTKHLSLYIDSIFA